MSIGKIRFHTQLDNQGYEAIFSMPTYGYSVQLVKAVTIQRFTNNVGAFNNGEWDDYRTVDFSVLLPESEVLQLAEFFKHLKNYGYVNEEGSQIFYMSISSGSNFFPAGPDYGDSGRFTVSPANNHSFSTMRTDYFGMFDCKLRLLIHGLQRPNSMTSIRELHGSYDFGDVKGLRDPERIAEQDYRTARNITIGGIPSHVQLNESEFTTTIMQRTTTAKMAELAYYLQKIRTDKIPVETKKGYWLFGPDLPESGRMFVKLLSNEFVFVHEGHDLWSVKIPLWYAGGEQ